MQSKIKVIVYGHSLNKEIALGGHLWLLKVTEELRQYNDLEVIHIEGPKVGDNRLKNLIEAYIKGFKVLKMAPGAILVDAGKDGNAALALLHVFFSRKTKIFIPFHHYEPIRIGKHTLVGYIFSKLLLIITYKLNEKLLKDASAIFVVSNTAKVEISKKFNIPLSKLVLTGNSVKMYEGTSFSKIDKFIDFLCIGRIGKFSNLVNIWKEIRKIRPEAFFHMAGIGDNNMVVKMLEKLGNFKHHGIVSEEEKINLYERSKVFIFPSMYEGFGIAVAEALSFGLPVIVWDLPVYDELWGFSVALRRVRKGNYIDFAKEAVYALDNFLVLTEEARNLVKKIKFSWKDIGKIVHDTILEHFKNY